MTTTNYEALEQFSKNVNTMRSELGISIQLVLMALDPDDHLSRAQVLDAYAHAGAALYALQQLPSGVHAREVAAQQRGGRRG